ncbi:MAG: DinB family protein [Anditalea sp.]
MNKPGDYFRQQLVNQIPGGNAFIKIEQVMEMVEFDQLGRQFPGLPYSYWQQFEHLRITQRDILEFSTNADYEALDWPKDYWPENPAPSSLKKWETAKEMFLEDRKAFLALILDKNNNLFQPFIHGNGQTLFREALLILEHNAYHTGQLLILVRLLRK